MSFTLRSKGAKGRFARLPIWDIVAPNTNTRNDRLRLYASSGQVKSFSERREVAKARLAEGFDTLKLRIHDFDERVDLAQIQDIAEAMQGRMRTAVDRSRSPFCLRYEKTVKELGIQQQ